MSIEVLAPVANRDMLLAALAAGADSIYLASKSFGARAYANNFTIEEIGEIVKLTRPRKVKVHVTVNTLIKEKEFEEAVSLIDSLYRIGVDAVIIQDIGLFSYCKDNYPGMEIHASTQISANSSYAINYLEGLGADRVILARELSYRDIERLAGLAKADLEVFGHGSLCVCYSGACTMSSFIGGRSGNRGRCAQPCRKPYKLLSPSGRLVTEGFILSPKDLAIGQGVKKLDEMGVKSVKIEGRMKKPDYVYASVNYYKSLARGQGADFDQLKRVSNRGFTKGLIGGELGRAYSAFDTEARGEEVGYVYPGRGSKKYILFTEDVHAGDGLEVKLEKKDYTITISRDYAKGSSFYLKDFPDALVKSKVYRLSSARLRDKDFESIVKGEKFPIDARLKAFVGSKPELEFTTDFASARISLDDPVEAAKKNPLDYKTAVDQIGRLGSTSYYLRNLDLDTDGRSFMARSVLNELRRNTLAKLLDRSSLRELKEKKPIKKDKIGQEEIISLATYKYSKDLEKLSWDELFLRDLDGAQKLNGRKIFYQLPLVLEDGAYEKERAYIKDHLDILDGLVVNRPWDLQAFRCFDQLDLVASEYTNAYNSWTSQALRDAGADRVILSMELSIKEMANMDRTASYQTLLYGRPIEMVMKYCPASVLGCDFNCQSCRFSRGHFIKNEMGDSYSFERRGTYTEIKNQKAINGQDKKKALEKLGIKSFLYRIDNKDDLDYLTGQKTFDQDLFRRGHFDKGVL